MTGPLALRSTSWRFAMGALLVLAVCLASGAYTVGRVKKQLYLEKTRAGEMMVNTLAGSARIPLLSNDSLSLHSLVEDATRVERLVYAVILDAGKSEKARANSARHGGILKEIPGVPESIGRGEQELPATDVLPSGAQLLRFSRPVTFTRKTIGYVVLGLSKDAIDDEVRAESRFLWVGFGVLGVCVIGLLAGGLILLSGRSTPVARDAGSAGAHGSVVQSPPESSLVRTHVTVLFAGVKGFKSYADTRDTEQVIRDMNDYFALATETITRFGGEVDKFVGDAVIGVFRSTVHTPDHVERAVRSAAALQESLRQRGGEGNPLYSLIGIGISSGVALAGRLAAGGYREPMYIGESFKSAYLLHVMSAPGEIVISRDVYQVIESSLSVEPLPPREMMEKTEPWENFRLLRVRDERTVGV